MTLPGLITSKNLSDIGNTAQAWDNLGSNLQYSYSALRANFVDNSAVIRSDNASNVIVSQASGIDLSYGNNYVYKITENAGVAVPFNFGYLTAGITSRSYVNPERRIGTPNGPIVGSILLKAGSHYSVGMALRPAYGGTFFKSTNYPVVSVNLLTGEYRDAFSNKQPYEIIGTTQEEDGWWRVSMSSICQQVYAVAEVVLFFFRSDSFSIIDPATSTDGSKFFYASLPQIETGHEPSSVIITTGDAPVARFTTAQSSGPISFTGDDVAAIQGINSVGASNIGKIKKLKTTAQPQISLLRKEANALQVLSNASLPTASPSSSGNYQVSSLVASGYYVGANAIGSVSGSPYSGNTALVPLYFSTLIPNSWSSQTIFASGSLSSASIAIPVEYNGFYVYIPAGQS